jgi:hypothetical protein
MTLNETTDDYEIREDSDLTPGEKETMIRFSKTDGMATVYSESGGIMRRLMNHPEADVHPDRVMDGTVVAVRGEVPIGCLKIMANERKNGGHSTVVSYPQ